VWLAGDEARSSDARDRKRCHIWRNAVSLHGLPFDLTGARVVSPKSDLVF
jgi:hypothetical protein